MSDLSAEAIIVHGCQLTPDGELSDRGNNRLQTAVGLWYEGAAPNIVLTGSHSFTLSEVPVRTEADAMMRQALEEGVPQNHLYVEDKSVETVGNVVLTKIGHILPNNWHDVIVVTSDSHMERTMEIYEHVLGPGYAVHPVKSYEEAATGWKRTMWEWIGRQLVDTVLDGTTVGDHEAIKSRLFDLVPGYDASSRASTKRLIIETLIRHADVALAKLPVTQYPFSDK